MEAVFSKVWDPLSPGFEEMYQVRERETSGKGAWGIYTTFFGAVLGSFLSMSFL